MRITSQSKGYTGKTVTISHDFTDRPVSDDLIVGWAMAKSGEEPSSLFGWKVTRHDDGRSATVTLHTD